MEPQQASILFADFAGFSRLRPAELIIFVKKVMPRIAEALRGSGAVVMNTWGDGIFAVFKTADVAANYALALRDVVANWDWSMEGIHNDDFGLRVALHNAHLLINEDPITQQMNAYGTHVNKAARLEPLALPNQVFATEEFIVALQGHGSRTYKWDSLGELTLAKDFGVSTVYHLHRHNERSLEARDVDKLRTRAVSLDTLMPHSRALLPSTNVSVSDTAQILKYIDENIMRSGIIRHNWNILVSYDLLRVSEGTVIEHLSWDYELVSHIDEAVKYPVTLWGAADMESEGGLRSLHKILPDGSLETIISPDLKSANEGGLTKRENYITLDPHIRYKLELEYNQSWSVNPKAPKIHNVFSPTNTALSARLRVEVPSGTKVDVLVDDLVLRSTDGDDGRQRVFNFNIPSPVLKDQAIEYHIVFPVS